MAKLIIKGKLGETIKVVYNMYHTTESCISSGGMILHFFNYFKGLCQGEHLSPLLFSLCINDVESYSVNSACEGVKIDDIIAYGEEFPELMIGLFVGLEKKLFVINYLGIIFHKNNKYNSAIKSLRGQGLKAMFCIQNMKQSLNFTLTTRLLRHMTRWLF